MTPRERVLTVIHGEIPNRVPVCPEKSNRAPAKLTGTFGDVYVKGSTVSECIYCHEGLRQ